MAITRELKAARKFGPGYFIKEQMELREWIQEDMAEVLGITSKHLNKILQDKQPLTLDMAKILAVAFNTSAQYWINLDTDYRLWLKKEKSVSEIEADTKAMIYERMPIADMVKKGWLPKPKSVNELKEFVTGFWKKKELNFEFMEAQLPCLTRKSDAYNLYNASYALTWFQMAQLQANTFHTGPYDESGLKALMDILYSYTRNPNGINLFIRALQKVGVTFLVLPHLQKTYLDGAAFIADGKPVIVYTGRYKRIDNFWFTVAHELAHVLLHLNAEHPFILDNLRDGTIDELEEEANQLASEKLRHPEIISFLDPYLNYLTTSKIEVCAEKLNIHPAIIIGKLAFDKKISYSNQSLYNENVLDSIDAEFKPIAFFQ